MSKYSFLDELLIAEGIVNNLNAALYTKDSARVYDLCREMRNSAMRIMRKVEAYNSFREHAELVAPWTKGVSFIEFDKHDGKEQNNA